LIAGFGDSHTDWPPSFRTVATVTFGLSVAVHMGMLSGDFFLYDFQYLARIPPQVWRLVTCFLITFPNLGVLFDTFHMYMYMSQLEKGHPRLSRREDLVWYLTFVCGTILVGLLVQTLLCSPVLPIYENPSTYLPG
jgi:Derlin-2/3